MSQDPDDVLRAYLDATEALDRAARSRDLSQFLAASTRWAAAAAAYADDLELNGYFVPAGLREQITRARGDG